MTKAGKRLNTIDNTNLLTFIMENIIIFHETIPNHGGPFGYKKLILTLNCIKK